MSWWPMLSLSKQWIISSPGEQEQNLNPVFVQSRTAQLKGTATTQWWVAWDVCWGQTGSCYLTAEQISWKNWSTSKLREEVINLGAAIKPVGWLIGTWLLIFSVYLESWGDSLYLLAESYAKQPFPLSSSWSIQVGVWRPCSRKRKLERACWAVYNFRCCFMWNS